jgi:MIP family channel proteins
VDGQPVQRIAAEFVGVFALILVAAGTSIYGDLVATALASGLVIAVMVTAVGHISGGHFNPAVTLAFLVTRRIGLVLAALYVIAQLGAAALAALFLNWILPSLPQVEEAHLGAPSLNETLSIDAGQGVAIEAALTFFLVWVIFATLVDERGTFRQVAGLAIGLTIAFGTLFAAFLTGAAMNPARAFGPELVSNYWTNWWVWYVGPIAGGVLAAVLYELLFLRPAGPPAAAAAAADEDRLDEAEAATEEPASGAEADVEALPPAAEERPPGTAAVD